jgi:hypothetical protein
MSAGANASVDKIQAMVCWMGLLTFATGARTAPSTQVAPKAPRAIQVERVLAGILLCLCSRSYVGKWRALGLSRMSIGQSTRRRRDDWAATFFQRCGR